MCILTSGAENGLTPRGKPNISTPFRPGGCKKWKKQARKCRHLPRTRDKRLLRKSRNGFPMTKRRTIYLFNLTQTLSMKRGLQFIGGISFPVHRKTDNSQKGFENSYLMKNNLHQGASGHTFQVARKNRQCHTGAETLLWKNLRNRKLEGFKF